MEEFIEAILFLIVVLGMAMLGFPLWQAVYRSHGNNSKEMNREGEGNVFF